MRFFSSVTIAQLYILMDALTDMGINGVEIILPYYENKESMESLERLLDKYSRIIRLVIYKSPELKVTRFEKSLAEVLFIEENIMSENCCGKIKYEYFNANIQLFTESQKYNSCLNRKIGIDTLGNIKNCPSMEKVYGNIVQDRIKDIVKYKNFKKYYYLNKDQITVCKDCEFRYVCVDCRAYTENNNLLGKPLKCNYDPYTAQWK